MALLNNILAALREWKTWQRIEAMPERLDTLEEQVRKLENALARCPGEACPFCGARAWRLKIAEEPRGSNIREIWHCEDCGKQREQFVPSGRK
ncbi:MAG: hypothetical protein L0287_15225 [Anaerolineae bacterium]|nr:hypothetical protein [Anaerolineae bacterium]